MSRGKQKILRFAALRRVSTEQQEKVGESLQTQTKDIASTVKDLGGVVVEWYGGQEHATPGHEKREVERLLHDAQRNRFDALIVAHPDRWSRDNSSSRAGLELFREHGVRFFAGATEYDLFNPDHELFLGISAVVGQFQARQQMLKSMKSRIERAKGGVPTGGRLPFGRVFVRSKDRRTGHWEIDPAKHEMVRDCAKRYLKGESLVDLAAEYNVNASNLWKVLTKVSGSKWKVEFSSKVLNLHEIVELDVPPLLDKETIEAICSKAEANRTYTHGHIKHRYLFSRMIFCAHCGYAMMGQTNQNTKRYYRHAHTERDRVCNGAPRKGWIPADAIEDNVMRHLFETFGNPVAVQRAIEEATPNSDRIQQAVKRKGFVEQELETIENSRQRILRLIVKGTIEEANAETELKKLKNREQKLTDERTRLEDELAHVPSREVLKSASRKIAGKFLQYTSAKTWAKTRQANEAFDAMSFEEKRALCESVFAGKTTDGRRTGISIAWDSTGKKWRYRIEGLLIDAEGPISEGAFVFGAPQGQKALVGKFASQTPCTSRQAFTSMTPRTD
jgi:Site-specific recombinases, DNA invertase Pin homologs